MVRGWRQYIDFMWPKWFQGIGSRLWSPHLDPVWGWLPSRCAICQSWPQSPLCETCISRFAQPQHRCSGCALPLPHPSERCGACIQTPPPLDRCLAATAYAWPWVDLIARYLERLMQGEHAADEHDSKAGTLTRAFLADQGFL